MVKPDEKNIHPLLKRALKHCHALPYQEIEEKFNRRQKLVSLAFDAVFFNQPENEEAQYEAYKLTHELFGPRYPSMPLHLQSGQRFVTTERIRWLTQPEYLIYGQAKMPVSQMDI